RAEALGGLSRGIKHIPIDLPQPSGYLHPGQRPWRGGQLRRSLIESTQLARNARRGSTAATITRLIFEMPPGPRNVTQEQRTFTGGGFEGGEAEALIFAEQDKAPGFAVDLSQL